MDLTALVRDLIFPKDAFGAPPGSVPPDSGPFPPTDDSNTGEVYNPVRGILDRLFSAPDNSKPDPKDFGGFNTQPLSGGLSSTAPELLPPLARGRPRVPPDAMPQAMPTSAPAMVAPPTSPMDLGGNVNGPGRSQPDFLSGLMQSAQNADWGGILKAALEGGMRGMAMTPVSANNPGGLSTMGGAFTAVRDRQKAEELAKQKMAASQDKLRFDQTLATRKDTREQAETDARIKKINRDLSVKSGIPGLSLKDAQKLNDQLNQYADKIKATTVDPNELTKALKAKRDSLLKDYIPGYGQQQSGVRPGKTVGEKTTFKNSSTGQSIKVKWDGSKWQPVE